MMANKYGNPTPKIVKDGLARGYSIDKMMIWNTDPEQASRLAWWMASLWLLYRKVNLTLDRIMLGLNAASIEEVNESLRIIIKVWKLFWYDEKKRRYYPNKPVKETDKQFYDRVQQTVRKQVRIWWIVSNLIEMFRDEKSVSRLKPSPHSNKEFMAQARCSEQTVTRYLNQVTQNGFGYALHFGGNGKGQKSFGYAHRFAGKGEGQKSYFVRPDHDPHIIHNLDQRYKEHKSTHQRPRRGAAEQISIKNQVSSSKTAERLKS
jgi:hypothetical protein